MSWSTIFFPLEYHKSSINPTERYEKEEPIGEHLFSYGGQYIDDEFVLKLNTENVPYWIFHEADMDSPPSIRAAYSIWGRADTYFDVDADHNGNPYLKDTALFPLLNMKPADLVERLKYLLSTLPNFEDFEKSCQRWNNIYR